MTTAVRISSRDRSVRTLAASAASVLWAAGLAVIVTAGPAAADETITVDPDVTGCTSPTGPCETVQDAVNAALALEDPGAVTVSVPAGTFVDPDGVLIGIATGTPGPTSLTIRGAGAASTTIEAGEDAFAVISADTDIPLTVDAVTLTGAAEPQLVFIPAAHGIFAVAPALTVEDTVITGLQGRDAVSAADVAARDASGVVGVFHGGTSGTSTTTIRRSMITGNTGGNSEVLSNPDGGGAIGVLAAETAVEIVDSTISGNVGGSPADESDGAEFGFGGNTLGAGVLAFGAPLRIVTSTIAGNTAPAAGQGDNTGDDTAGSGGSAISAGVWAMNDEGSTEILRSTISGHRAGKGGAGGAAAGNAGGGSGGESIGGGVLAMGQLLIDTSTIADNSAGDGGAGGNTADVGDSASGNGGDAIAFGVLAIALEEEGPDSQIVHSTVVGTAIGSAGRPGDADDPDRVEGEPGTAVGAGVSDGGAEASVEVAGADDLADPSERPQGVREFVELAHSVAGGFRASAAEVPTDAAELVLTRSLLHNPDVGDCLELPDQETGAIVDGGFNVDHDGTCVSDTPGSSTDPGIGADLSALANNGGPTRTVALAKNSPAATAVPVGGGRCEAPDQRGRPRPGVGAPDACAAGAFEPQRGQTPDGGSPDGTGSCEGRAATITGTPGDDELTGTPGPDVIVGLGGDDEIDGRGGDDIICGDDGRDRIDGDDGDDRLLGNDGRDRLRGGSETDRLIGGDGRDKLKGGDGKDRLSGQEGKDKLSGQDGKDKLSGGDGKDDLTGGDGKDQLRGGEGDDTLKGRGNDDRLKGNTGDDELDGGDGTDRGSGGPGRDELSNIEIAD